MPWTTRDEEIVVGNLLWSWVASKRAAEDLMRLEQVCFGFLVSLQIDQTQSVCLCSVKPGSGLPRSEVPPPPRSTIGAARGGRVRNKV